MNDAGRGLPWGSICSSLLLLWHLRHVAPACVMPSVDAGAARILLGLSPLVRAVVLVSALRREPLLAVIAMTCCRA